jgi:hypothetical protein
MVGHIDKLDAKSAIITEASTRDPGFRQKGENRRFSGKPFCGQPRKSWSDGRILSVLANPATNKSLTKLLIYESTASMTEKIADD